MNTSGPRMSYSDFPAPDYYRDYPMHWQVAEYFDRYVDHFGMRDTITFNTTVEQRRARATTGVWEVTITGDGAGGGREVREYDAVLVGNGHHWDPRWPDPPFPGSDSFDGVQMHAHDYRDSDSSPASAWSWSASATAAMDIACALELRGGQDLSSPRAAGSTCCASASAASRSTSSCRRRGCPGPEAEGPRDDLEADRATVSDFGLPEPDHKVGHAHPTLSAGAL